MKNKILVIKHGGIGSFFQTTGAFAAIREKHKNAHITLMTSVQFGNVAKQSPYFDEVWVDTMPKFWQLNAVLELSKRLREGKFSRVYDLQCSNRSSMYFRIMGRKKPEWCGVVEWCSHPYKAAKRKFLHTLDRLDEQLEIAEINNVPDPDISWLKSDIGRFSLPLDYALIMPGSGIGDEKKRWHKKGYEDVIRWLDGKNITPVFIGSHVEEEMILEIIKNCSDIKTINLVNKASFADIAEISRVALIAIGGEIGPMYIPAIASCPSLMIFSALSVPELCAPVGENVVIIEENELDNLGSEDVIAFIDKMLAVENLDSPEKQPKT